MFRSKEDELKSGIKTVNCLISDGGVGDLLASLMSVNYILENCPWINLLIWVPDYMKDFAKHVLKSNAVIRNYTEAQDKYEEDRLGITTKWNSQHTPMRTNAVKYSYHMLCDFSPTIEQMSYLKIDSTKINLKKFKLPNKIVAIQGAYVEQVKTMPEKTFNGIVDYVIERGYTPVFLGKTELKTGMDDTKILSKISSGYNLKHGINLLNKTSLLESAAIIQQSKAFISMDSGLTHLAGFTDTPMVVGYTFASPDQLMVIRDGIQGKNVYPVIPDESLGCRFCQTNLTLYYNHDFRDCLYTDFLCVKQMTSEKFIKELDKIL